MAHIHTLLTKRASETIIITIQWHDFILLYNFFFGEVTKRDIPNIQRITTKRIDTMYKYYIINNNQH